MVLYYMGYYFHPSYLLVILATIVVMLAQAKINGAYRKYSRVQNHALMTGEEVARRIIATYGLDVRVEKTSGHLSDHFDPKSRVVRLSAEIYEGTSIASLAVAAHECGHALQHQENYHFLKLRNSLLPLANGGNFLGWIAIMIGLFSNSFEIAMIGFAMLMFMLAFQIVTLPVEFDASKRALRILSSDGYLDMSETDMAKQMLQAAALTYVAGVASAILNLLRVFWIISDSSRRD